MVSGAYRKFIAPPHQRCLGRWPRAAALALLLASCKLWAATTCPTEDGTPIVLHPEHRDGERYMHLRLRGSLRLSPRAVDGLHIHGLSGLAWSADRQLLYALSDLGFIVWFQPIFSAGILSGAHYCNAYPLRDPRGHALTFPWNDAEGLSARRARNGRADDEELLVSFEQRPRIDRYSPTGQYLGALDLPLPLHDRAAYAGPNQALEAVTETRRFGVVMAPERPLRDTTSADMTIFSAQGRSWPYHPLDARYGGLVGLETMPDDQLLVLERRFVSIFRPLIIGLSRVELADSPDHAARQTEIARFDTSQGWAMDNFESVAWHEDNRYFMISDDNAHPLQHTLLVYFEILESDGRAPPVAPPASPFSRH